MESAQLNKAYAISDLSCMAAAAKFRSSGL